MHAPIAALDRSWPQAPAGHEGATSVKLRFVAWFTRATAALVRAHRLRRDTRQLLRFSDAMLSDIGLGRGEVVRAVRVGRERP